MLYFHLFILLEYVSENEFNNTVSKSSTKFSLFYMLKTWRSNGCMFTPYLEARAREEEAQKEKELRSQHDDVLSAASGSSVMGACSALTCRYLDIVEVSYHLTTVLSEGLSELLRGGQGPLNLCPKTM